MRTANPLKFLSAPSRDIQEGTKILEDIWRAEDVCKEVTNYVVVIELIITTLVMLYVAMTKQKKVEKEVPEVVVKE